MLRRRRLSDRAVLALAVALGACSGGTVGTTTTMTTMTTVTTTTVTDTTSSEPVTTSTTIPADQTVTVLLAPFSEIGPGWVEQVFPYGDTDDTLGTSPGGDGLMLGPEYGTQSPDGSWWFLDAARLRVAHFAEDGTFLDQALIPEDLLVDGQYFQYQMPQALDDGSITAAGFRGETTMALLRVVDGEASGSNIEAAVPWVTTDGTYLYGLGLEDGSPYRLDPHDPVVEPVEWLIARDGSRYRVTVEQDEVLVELPDAPTPSTRTLQMRFSEDPSVIAHAGIEVETGADGTIFILFYGAPESDETLGIGGFVSIGIDGIVGDAESITDPFSLSDPGSPAHLGARPGTSSPWVMVVGEDGVHVFTRSD
ncbi:MAG TPA: hypothetical protein VIH55_04890 [Acidimicrobiia bacterium]